MDTLHVQLLGGFSVTTDGRTIPADAFPQRRAADLVKVLALAPGHRLPRDAAVEALWPHLGAEAGLANLHKAAHHARRALGAPQAVVLRKGMVELAPAAQVSTDVARFEAGDDAAYGGELLPDDRYEPWTLATREGLRERRLALLRRQERWSEVLADDPADEEAHRGRMRQLAAAGDLAGAARQFRLLREALARLGLRPDAETLALQQEISIGPAVMAHAVLGGPMLGRGDELATASRALADAADGRGGALLVVGDAGIGKTRFVDAIATMAAQRGRHVLRATAREAEGRTPYRPLAEALEPLMSERPDLVAGLSEPTQRVLGLLSPVAMTAGAGTARGQDVLAAIGRLLAAAARERGAVLAIEDLHVADETTVRVLQYVVAAARRERLLVVMSLRPDEGAGSVAALRHGLLEQRGATEIALGPLTPERMRPLVRRAAPRPLGEDALEAIVAAAAGNPFYAEELAAAGGGSGGLIVPVRLEALLDARLDRLLAVTGPRLVEVLAVVDDGCTTAELAAIARRDEATVAGELEAGRATGVVERADGGWRFRHPMLRAAARRRLPAPHLAEAHRDAAAHLAARGGAPERIATHLLEGGRPAEAVPLLCRAAKAAAEVGAFADGERWVQLALRHAECGECGELRELLADLRHATGDPRAPADYASARAQAVPEAVLRLRLKEARASMALGDLAGAHAAMEAAGDDHGPDHARDALLLKGMIAWHRGDMDAARRFADEAAAHTGGDPAFDVVAYDLHAMVSHAEGRWERAMQAQLAEVWHVPQLAGRVLEAYLCVTEYVLNASDPAETLMRFAQELHEQAASAGARRGMAFAATVLGEAHLLAGDPETAREHLADAARLSREAGAVGGEALARTRLGEALAVLGHKAASRAQLEEATELAHASPLAGHILFLAHAPLVRASEDPAEAMLLVDRAEALLDPCPSCRFCPIEYYVAAAIACARAGEPERGRGFLERAEASAALWAGGPRSAAVAEARGELLRAEGREDEAEVAFRRAAEGYAMVGHRLHEERVLDLLAASTRVLAPAAP